MRSATLQAGQLRHRIAIESVAEVSDDQGGTTQTWSTFLNSWASVENSGQELLAAQRLQSNLTHRILMRYQAGITTKMRVNYEGRLLNIRAVHDINEIHRTIELICEEGVGT